MKTITLCADDFGQNDDISLGILDLVAARRLSAVSCLTEFPAFATHAQTLLNYQQQVQIGLHFNLTEGEHALATLLQVIVKAHARVLNRKIISAAFDRQLQLFEKHLGFKPIFIDGHQHVQHLPIVREVIFEKMSSLPKTYVRSSYSSWRQCLHFPKALIINLTGARVFRKLLDKKNIPHNASFAGIYDFKHADSFPEIFQKKLAQVSGDTLMMCHPGRMSTDVNDGLKNSRHLEYEYFRSRQFIKDCQRFRIEILGVSMQRS